MAIGLLKPVAIHNGLPCSGHGIAIPLAKHHASHPCGAPPIPKPIKIKNKTCWWGPQSLIPLTALNPLRATVLVNGTPIMLMGDTFTPHKTVTTNIVVYMCPCGTSVCPKPTPIPCGKLTIEDMGGIGHTRTLQATTTTVYALKLPIGRILDPLGIGKTFVSWPCSSVVSYGSPTVLAG